MAMARDKHNSHHHPVCDTHLLLIRLPTVSHATLHETPNVRRRSMGLCSHSRRSCHLPKQMSLRRNGCTSIHASTARTTRRSCSTLLYMGYWVSTMHDRNSALYTHRLNVLMMNLSHPWVSPGSTNSIMTFVVLSESSKAILQ
jgi:hypothetical protein